MIIPKTYVINLKKRTERLEKFMSGYALNGPAGSNPGPIIIQAIDGTMGSTREENFAGILSEIERVAGNIDLSGFSMNTDNNFNSDPRVYACALSHIIAWTLVADSGVPGIIFEDDINFREDSLLQLKWPDIWESIDRVVSTTGPAGDARPVTGPQGGPAPFRGPVVYLGAGDMLPIHLNICSEPLMRAQEKSHITKKINEYVGTPNYKSAFVFGWIGAFSYVIGPETARGLLSLLKTQGITKAIDVFLKDNTDTYMTCPLMAYHDTLETCTSDIQKVQRR
jgi:GR25 family glycosyltransferase involved in LPS biosynthesis